MKIWLVLQLPHSLVGEAYVHGAIRGNHRDTGNDIDVTFLYILSLMIIRRLRDSYYCEIYKILSHL